MITSRKPTLIRCLTFAAATLCLGWMVEPLHADPVLLASDQVNAHTLRLDNDELYFITGSGSGPYFVNSVPPTGGSVTPLVEINHPGGTDQGASGLMFDDDNFYGWYGGYNPGAIWTAPKSGSLVTANYLVQGIGGGGFLTQDATRLFYNTGFSSPITAINKDGSNQTSWGDGVGWVRSNFSDGDYLYTQDYYSRQYSKISLADGTTSSLGVSDFNEFGGFADDSNLYFVNKGDSGDIDQYDKDGNYLATLVNGGVTWASGSDGTNVYFYDSVLEAISSVPVGGGTVTPLYSIAQSNLADFMVADGTLFWAEFSLEEPSSRDIYSLQLVPEPTSCALLMTGLGAAMLARRRALKRRVRQG